MNLNEMLTHQARHIIDDAMEAMSWKHLERYEALEASAARSRIARLYRHTLDAVRSQNPTDLLLYVAEIARERYAAGFRLREIQTAFNILEEAIWAHILTDLDTDKIVAALGLVSTALGLAKDRLAVSYVALAKQGPPSVDPALLMRGTVSN